MKTALEEVKQRFPQYSVTLGVSPSCPDLANRITVFAEGDKKCNPDGSPNPEYWWHEWPVDIAKDETKINKELFLEGLDDLEGSIKKQVDYYLTRRTDILKG